MAVYRWVRCGDQLPRLDLFGGVLIEETEPPAVVDDQEPPQLFVRVIPVPRPVLEGAEASARRFLDLVWVRGWKLVLKRTRDEAIEYDCYLIGHWEVDTHLDYYPGGDLSRD